jgi:transposase-like protein
MMDVTPDSQAVDLDEFAGDSSAGAGELDAVDEQLIARLAGRARAGGLALTGEAGLLAQLTKRLVESALEGEITDHLGYDRHDAVGRDGGNSRNGHRSKTLLTEVGPVQVDVPRDRDATFEPRIVAKRKRRLSGVDELVISLSAKGLTTGEVAAHLAEVYGADVSRQTISTITDKVIEGMAEWQNRPLDPVYPVIFIDAINVKIRDGKVANRPIYVALAVTSEGRRDILGLWAGEAPSVTGAPGGEGAKYWLHVLTEIKNRGVGDVLMVVCDGLTGLPDAISAVWPATITQTCVVHLLRNSFRYAGRQHYEATTRPSPGRCARSTPPPPRRRRWNGSWSSARPGASAIPRSCGCGRTPGRSSCRSCPSTSRSARSSAQPTRSSRSTPVSAGRSRPADTSPTSKPRSSASTWPS